jgi:polyferredoxin
MDGIAPGRDPDELAIALGHQHRVDVMVGACGLRIDACNEVMKRVGRPPGLIDFSGQTMREAARDRSRIVLRVALVRPRTAVYALMLLAGSSLILWSLTSHASILG